MKKDELLTKKVALVTLGCDKNRVDAENMLYFLNQFGFSFSQDPLDAEIVICNTCAFISDSRKESLETIIGIRHNSKKLEKMIVTGCLGEKNLDELKENLTEADLVLPLKENKYIVRHILNLYGLEEEFSPKFCGLNRIVSTPKHYAYLKIADGCNNFCAYCTIPFIRGRYHSVPLENLLKEAEELVRNGAKELILIAQDVTKYGYDLYGEYKIVELIRELSKIEDLKWIRLLYCYPELVSDELIDEIDINHKVCAYIDIPMQHINDRILGLMNRKGDKNKIESVVKKILSAKNYICIRSTFILGFPTEKRKDVKELEEFLKKNKLNNVGFFAYSKEEGTKAYYYKKQIPNFVKKIRVKKLQKLQNNVIIENNKKLIGKILDCVCDDVGNFGSVLRSEYNAPEIDTVVYVQNKNLQVGEFYKVKITGYSDVDLVGEIIYEA